MTRINFRVSMLVFLIILRFFPAQLSAQNPVYEPTWESLDSRPNPAWFDSCKYGMKIHWGVFSVPSWAPKGVYAEWYWYNIQDKNDESYLQHTKLYGGDYAYQNFAYQFKAELFDPDAWADLFVRGGVKYVVLTSKHHEGYPLWPSTDSWNWNSMDVGPHRDLVKDITDAMRARGMYVGYYFSFYEWFNPMWQNEPERFVKEHMIPQMTDLVLRYHPDMMYGDGEWDHPSDFWKTREWLAWLFNESPVKDHVVINDRWGNETRSHHGGFYLSEYGKYTGANAQLGTQHIWCETRSLGASFGYNRNEDIDDYQSAEELVHLLVYCVSRGGGLMLNVGPRADGTIPVIMQERLIQIGDWLKVNGEAIYGTKAWRETNEGKKINYTMKNGDLYAITIGWPGKELMLDTPVPSGSTKVSMLGYNGAVSHTVKNGKIHIEVPQLSVDEVPCFYAYTFKITGIK